MISANVVADTVSPTGARITTMELEFPRIILAEFNTHRRFSRNAASSRAIPIQRVIDAVRDDPYVPREFRRNQAGMVAGERLEGTAHERASTLWLSARDAAVQHAEELDQLGVHKQWTNRILEPYQWTRVVVTSTEWGNFFDQRLHEDAQPDMRDLAQCMENAWYTSIPRVDEAHLPFVLCEETDLPGPVLMMLSASRCARVSYYAFGSDRGILTDLMRAQKLCAADPPHWSPFEHPAASAIAHHNWDNYQGWKSCRNLLTSSASIRKTYVQELERAIEHLS